MIALLDTIGPAIGRASWQAAILAILVVLLLKCLGERLQPRWRFLLWGVVVARLLFVVTPNSPCSLFNLTRWKSEAIAPPMAQSSAPEKSTADPRGAGAIITAGRPLGESPHVADRPTSTSHAETVVASGTPSLARRTSIEVARSYSNVFDASFIARIAAAIWLVGCVFLGLRLLAMAAVLRKRLSACRPVADPDLLSLVATLSQPLRLKRAPVLLVTPECFGPCVVGVENPRIVLPESILTQGSTERIRHVLAHELAHLVRGDLWMNWLMLTARTLHWFNPVAWWIVREMQAEREAACDELAAVTLGEPDRTAYAVTIVELATSLVPSLLTPGLIGLFSPSCRLRSRVERLLNSPTVRPVRATTSTGLLLGLALVGLTDALPHTRALAAGMAIPARRPNVDTRGLAPDTLNEKDGCVVTGTVTDKITGKPAAGAVITARRLDEPAEFTATSDENGRFRLPVPEGRYNFQVEMKDRVCLALTDRECLAGEKMELPPFTLIGGGFISGRVINTATKESVSVIDGGEAVMLGLFGPSHPSGPFHPFRLASVDKSGRFTMRAVPGENFPYLVNTRGDRMCWDTQKQPAVVVKDGETTAYDMLITPEVTPEERLRAAHKLVAALPKKPTDRTAQIVLEFRKLNHTVNETELWCLLMRELWMIGRDAVPQLCAELDRTSDDRTLRRLGFALRTIDDPRAVPALIRALPKTLLPSSSDYGLIVGDKELMEFMQAHELRPGIGGAYFSLGRPVREIVDALHKLTDQDFEDAELFSMSLSEDPRRQVLQRRIYGQHAQRWATWWETHWKEHTQNAVYRTVNLNVVDEPLPPIKALGKTARIDGEWDGADISPAVETSPNAWNAYDLDTGRHPIWPASIPRDESSRQAKQVTDWASQTGVDLICSTHRSPDGTETFVLRAIGMKVREISPRDARNLDRLLAAGTLPKGRPVEELLMHYDPQTKQLVPDANAAFFFETREGTMGVIETTDRVTRVANVAGMAAGGPAGGVGFHKGVRFNLKTIVP